MLRMFNFNTFLQKLNNFSKIQQNVMKTQPISLKLNKISQKLKVLKNLLHVDVGKTIKQPALDRHMHGIFANWRC